MAIVARSDSKFESKFKENTDSAYKSIFGEDPTTKVNSNMLNFSLNFDPLKEVLNSLISSQKLTKNRLDEVIAENTHVKNTLADYEEKFVFIESKIGKVIGKFISISNINRFREV